MRKIFFGFTTILMAAQIFSACNNNNATTGQTTIDSVSRDNKPLAWGDVDGKKVFLYTLKNKTGSEVKITNYGGTVTSWITPDKHGQKSSIVLGFHSLEGYLKKPPYFGAIIGRYGNRIGDAAFSLDGHKYQLAANNGKNHLHGGNKGFDKVVWEVEHAPDSTASITLSYLSKDGEEGYPGNLKTTVTYTLTDENKLIIEYNATTDKATPANLTNHSYFNLTGDVAHSILDHSLQISADRYTPVDSTLIPTGELKSVKGSPFDFTQPHKIGERIQLVKGGYDHNFVLNQKDGELGLAATLTDAVSGRQLKVWTTEPGLQFYSGNFLDGSIKTDDGRPINQHAALCLETQHFPDSPNKPAFPTTILKPGKKYHTVTVYEVLIEK